MKTYSIAVVYSEIISLGNFIERLSKDSLSLEVNVHNIIEVTVEESGKVVKYEYQPINYSNMRGEIWRATCGGGYWYFEVLDGTMEANDIMYLQSRIRMGCMEVVDGKCVGHYTSEGKLVEYVKYETRIAWEWWCKGHESGLKRNTVYE